MTIRFLEAFNGDCIHISFKDAAKAPRNILIDGGVGKTYLSKGKKKVEYNALFHTINSIKENKERIDLLVLTHVDDDHIGGLLKWLQHDSEGLDLVDKIWFNSGRLIKNEFSEKDNLNENDIIIDYDPDINTSITQGVAFEEIVCRKANLWEQKLICKGYKTLLGDVEISVLSPNRDKLQQLVKKWEKEYPLPLLTSSRQTDFGTSLKDFVQGEDLQIEDKAIHNGSSIALLLTRQGKNFLLLSDAHPSVISESLQELGHTADNPLVCELVKLSHHGSMFNNTNDMLSLFESSHYFISTNGDVHGHPHKQMIARLIKSKKDPNIHFNYPELIREIFLKEDYENYPYLKNLSNQNIDFNF